MAYQTMHARYTSELSEIDVKFSQEFEYYKHEMDAVGGVEIDELYICGAKAEPSDLPKTVREAIIDLSDDLFWE